MTSFNPHGARSARAGVDMVRVAFLVLALAALALLAGCANTRGGTIPYEVQNFGTPDRPSAAAIEEDYRIAPLDTLKIAVFQVPDLSGEYEVDLTGNVALPLLGTVKAIDKTPSTLQAELASRLGEKYLQSPQVSVGVKSSTTRNVTLDGAVRYPGMYPIERPVTLVQAIALAKGPTEEANPRRVAVFRTIGGQRMAAAFDLSSIRKGEAEDPKIYSGDIIIVDGSKIKQAQREVFSVLPILGIFNPFSLIGR
jgi:polysaccharide export outer membrane protein